MAVHKPQVYLFCIALFVKTTVALWSCTNDLDCSSTEGALCVQGGCVCPLGQEAVLGGTRCVDVAPYYHLSGCMEDFQCSRLVAGFSCTRSGEDEGFCDCAAGHHYFRGRCWPSREYGESCIRDEQCQSILRNPFNMQCANGFCACAEGYYLRQRGECRKIGYGVGDGCVLDVDCQFQNGVCDQRSFTCYNSLEGIPEPTMANLSSEASVTPADALSRQDGALCTDGPCQAPFVCTSQNICACPVGYFPDDDGTNCMAHLGSPGTAEQCIGLFKIIEDGVCTCQANFYYENNMRDCAKATLRISDSCLTDAMCHTFGAASYCGQPVEPWGLRSCQCNPEIAVRNDAQSVCQLFRGLDEECESDDECYAGELPVNCAADDSGTRRCTCPAHLRPEAGLCLDSDLVLGDTCQVTAECDGTLHAVCENSVCACDSNFQQVGDLCSPQLGGDCVQDSDCIIEHTACVHENGTSACQCVEGFVRFEDECLTVSEGYNSTCIEDVQCRGPLGDGGACIDNACFCSQGYHFLNERCWRSIGLQGECSRSIDCFLGELTHRVVCRNSLCQCDFDYVYLEDENTCGSATSITFNKAIFLISILSYFIQRYM